jgi:uncharacterized damage-inducible protein DinB
MKAIDLIRGALQLSDDAIMMLAGDLGDAPLTAPTPRGGNHPLWVLGHITFVEGSVPHVLFGEPNAVANWAHLFAPGTQALNDAKTYPRYEEVLSKFRELRTRNLKILDTLGEEGLDQPTQAPPRDLKDVLGTAGQAFLTIAMHHISHRGQLADARRALGRKPVFTPSLDRD